MAEKIEREPHFAGADDPPDEAQSERCPDAAALAIKPANMIVDRVGTRGQRARVALAEYF